MRDNDQTAAHAVILCAVVIGSGIIAIIAFRAADARRGDVSGLEGREHAAQFGQHGFKPCFCVGRGLRQAGGKALHRQASLIAVHIHAFALRFDELNGRLLIGGRVEQPRVGNIKRDGHHVVGIRLIGVIRCGRRHRRRLVDGIDRNRRGQRIIHLRKVKRGIAVVFQQRNRRGGRRDLWRGGFGIGRAEHKG